MISNHYAMTYAHEYNWLILIAISLAGALIRVYFVARHKGKASPAPIIAAALILLGIAAAIAPKTRAATGGSDVSFAEVRSIVHERCTPCHSANPTHFAFPAAAGGVAWCTYRAGDAEEGKWASEAFADAAADFAFAEEGDEAAERAAAELVLRWMFREEAGDPTSAEGNAKTTTAQG